VSSRAAVTYRLGAAAARALPGPVAGLLGHGLSAAVLPFAGDRRSQIERNLRRIDPTLSGIRLHRAVQATFANYAAYWVESFRLPGTPAGELAARMSVEGWEGVEAARAAGRGVILALPHLGGWEWAGFWVAACQQVPITVVVEALEPPDVFEWFVDLRESLGMRVVPVGPKAIGGVLAALRANHVVCLLSDRDIGGGGVEVEFLGERTTLPAGPATISLRTGAPILPTAVYVDGRHHRALLRPPLAMERQGRLRDDVTRTTQLLAHELELLIRRAPQQWHMLQPNWPSDPGHPRHRATSILDGAKLHP
jgi:KDO2-lipid IV(A) lauroyltransferase